jgi:hypothetical protein
MGAKTQPSPTFPQFPGGAAAITPSDSVNITPCVVFAGVGGAIKVTTFNGDEVTFSGVSAGTCLPVQVIRVWSTGTTATSLVAIY